MSKPNGVHALVRRTHEERVLALLRERGALRRAEIANQVGLSRTTLSEIANSLLERRAIVVVDTDAVSREGSGRPAERLALDPASGQFLGLDFGHRRVHVAVADASHEIIASGLVRYSADTSWTDRMDSAFALIDGLMEQTGVHFGALQGIGIGVVGPFSSLPKGRVAEAQNARWEVSELVEAAFAKRFDAPVIVDNNSRFAALAEAISGNADNINDLIYVRLSDGIGGGLVVGGRLITGSAGFAGEVGHIVVRPDGGIDCRCGKRGCLETVASVPAILRECGSRGVPLDNLEELQAAVTRADPIVNGVLMDAGSDLGRVLGALAVALNPSDIVIGGHIATIAPAIVQQVTTTLTYELFSFQAATPDIRVTRLSDDDGALGALAALFHQSPLLASYPAPAAPASAPHLQRSIS
ncbi:putative NBD/HSP70 family sugar kinase [Marisediminicola sp. UYEF4]|uniref:ROK family transcriptional regulator n=1 Tax=Marisediminicola sp. UYEF4 TaxID=1756384 RepID=UPI00339B65AE